MAAPEIYIGTAGWSYKDWTPNFYPETKTKEFDQLVFYSNYFNFVEVNSSYYTYINNKTVESWINKVENRDDFQFALKIHQDFTHKRKYTNSNIKGVEANLNLLAREERLAGLLLQFPYSFECNQVNIEYLGNLVRIFEQYNLFVEVRHNSWKGKKAKTVTFCTVDQPEIGMSIPFIPTIGNNIAYVRFHGRNSEAWINSLKNFGKKQTYDQQNARYNYLYSPGEMAAFNSEIRELYEKVRKIYVVMNNHPKGDAIANAFEFLHLLKGRTSINMPNTILAAYPRLNSFSLT